MRVSSWIPIFLPKKKGVPTSILRTYDMECCLVTATLTLLPKSLEKVILTLRPSLKQRTGRDVSSVEEAQ